MNVPLLILLFAAPVVGLMLTTLDGPTFDRWFGPPGQRNEIRGWLIGWFVLTAVFTTALLGTPTTDAAPTGPDGCFEAPYPYGDC